MSFNRKSAASIGEAGLSMPVYLGVGFQLANAPKHQAPSLFD
jgi:hypothetical protein